MMRSSYLVVDQAQSDAQIQLDQSDIQIGQCQSDIQIEQDLPDIRINRSHSISGSVKVNPISAIQLR